MQKGIPQASFRMKPGGFPSFPFFLFLLMQMLFSCSDAMLERTFPVVVYDEKHDERCDDAQYCKKNVSINSAQPLGRSSSVVARPVAVMLTMMMVMIFAFFHLLLNFLVGLGK